MTNLEALRARVGYPLTNNALEYALEKRELAKDDVFYALDNVQAFDLAYADSLCMVLTNPTSLGEGGFQVSLSDRKTLSEIANKIYSTYSMASPLLSDTPRATFVQRW